MSATGSSIHTITVMGTFATIQVVGDPSDPEQIVDREAAIERAFGWFHRIEACCSRFEPASELSQLARQIGVPIPVSEILFEAVQFAIGDRRSRGGQLSRRAARSGASDDHAASAVDARSRSRREGTRHRHGRARAGVIHRLRHRRRRRPVPRWMPAGRRAVDGGHPASAARSRAHRRGPRLELRGLHVGRLRAAKRPRCWTSHHRCAGPDARSHAGQRHRRGADRDPRRCACDRGVRARS